MSLQQVPAFLREHYEVGEWRHAVAILTADFPEEWADIAFGIRSKLYVED
jgi:hypothetical protein